MLVLEINNNVYKLQILIPMIDNGCTEIREINCSYTQ